MKTSVRNFSLYKDDIRGETLAYPVVDDSHQYEPVRSLHPQLPLEKSKNQNIVRDCHYVVIYSFHDVRTVFTRSKKCLTSQDTMLFNISHALLVQLFSISLAFLKKAKKKKIVIEPGDK